MIRTGQHRGQHRGQQRRSVLHKAVGVLALACAPLLPCGAASASEVAEATPAQSPAPANPEAAAATFDRLKSLEGEWRNAERPDSTLRIRFYTTAGGSVLVEAWEVPGRTHSLTLYHRDGDGLIATHYCPQGNQPRMALVPGGPEEARFTFRDATDLDPETEQYQHDLSLTLEGPDRLIRSEVYRGEDGAEEPSRLVLERVL